MTFLKFCLCFTLTSFIFVGVLSDQELWEKDMTKEIYIENSNEGFEYVNLTCTNDKVTFCFHIFSSCFTLLGNFCVQSP
jgi:hypothetical protein